jgi:hypothetical protein
LYATFGCDISWSRIHVGRSHFRPATLFVSELEALPLADDSMDVVYTSHAIEPNWGRESVILAELYRVAGRYLVLFEPSYELASAQARARMDAHGYCRGLREMAEQLNFDVIEHRLIDCPMNPLNPTALLLIEKRMTRQADGNPAFFCPSCRGPLVTDADCYFCPAEGLVYPTLKVSRVWRGTTQFWPVSS